MSRSLRILALNHRCLRHPEAGGSEQYLFEIARQWVMEGHQVTVITTDPGRAYASRSETVDGMRILRMGGRFTIFLFAALFLIRFGRRFDRIIDISNGLPFFTPLLTSTPSSLVVHHVHTTRWAEEFPRPFASIGCFIERYVVPRVYRKSAVITGSPTSREKLLELGFEQSQVQLILYGVQHPSDTRWIIPSQKQRIAYVGRLKRYKRVDHLVRLVAELVSEFSDLHLDIAGDGESKSELAALVSQLGLEDRVTLHGFVDDEVKSKLLYAATVFAMPSEIEGWGLSVIEANAHGCPAVGYDVPGLDSSVKHDGTGLLAADYDSFREAVASILRDPSLRLRLSTEARTWAASFNWERCASQTLAVLVGSNDEGFANIMPSLPVTPVALN